MWPWVGHRRSAADGPWYPSQYDIPWLLARPSCSGHAVQKGHSAGMPGFDPSLLASVQFGISHWELSKMAYSSLDVHVCPSCLQME